MAPWYNARAMAAAFAEVDWYDVPLYYDMVFDESTRREGKFLERVVELIRTA